MFFEVEQMQGPENHLCLYVWSEEKKKQLKQFVCSVQLMQGWLVLHARPQRGAGGCVLVVETLCRMFVFSWFYMCFVTSMLIACDIQVCFARALLWSVFCLW